MKKILLYALIFVVAISGNLFAGGMLPAGGITVAYSGTPAGCDLLSYDAEAYSDGDNLGDAGWSSGTTDDTEIDDTGHNGSNSIRLYLTTTNRTAYKTFTSQNSTFTVSMWVTVNRTMGTPAYFLSLSKGTSDCAYVYFTSATVMAANGAGSTSTGHTITPDTWFQVEYEINPAAETYKVRINGGTPTASLDFENSNSSVDTIEISTYAIDSRIILIDDICVTEGAWE